MKFTKTLVAAALFASAGAANASIATGTSMELFLQVYDQSQGLTYDLDLGSNANANLASMANAVSNQITLHYDLSGDSKWQTFTANLNAATTKFGVAAGNSLKAVFTSASANPVLPGAGSPAFTAITTAIKNQAANINLGTTANVAENLSKLVSDADTAKTGQWAAAAAGANPMTTLYGTYTNANAGIAYGATGNFFYDVSTATTVTMTKLGSWTLAGNSLDFAYNAPVTSVPLPAAVWMFGAGLMGVLRLNRRKSAAV